jgi:hypothetical protein
VVADAGSAGLCALGAYSWLVLGKGGMSMSRSETIMVVMIVVLIAACAMFVRL